MIAYTTPISACAPDERKEQALQLVETMQSRVLMPDVITYNTLINSCTNGERIDKALQLFETMRSQLLTPDVITYQSLRTRREG